MLDPEDQGRGREAVEAPFARGLERLAETRDDVVVVAADLAKWTDVLPFARAHPDRFVQVGMAEQNLMGVAAGLAKTGFLPIAVTFGVFATRRAYDQIAMSLATRPCRAILAGFLPGLDSRFRGTHQAIDDLAIIRSLPGITVLDPGCATELEEAVGLAAEVDGLTYIRCSRGRIERLLPPGLTVGPARPIAAGDGRVGVVSTGAATRWVAEVRGPETGHLHVPTLKPFPVADVARFAARFERVVSVENHLLHGGLGASVAAALAVEGTATPLRMCGIEDRWGEYGRPEFSRERLGLGPAHLREAMAA